MCVDTFVSKSSQIRCSHRDETVTQHRKKYVRGFSYNPYGIRVEFVTTRGGMLKADAEKNLESLTLELPPLTLLLPLSISLLCRK